jgi:hypothetical protein
MDREIIWNLVNSILAGGLVFLGSLTTGQITKQGLCFAGLTAAVVAITKFKDYWTKEEEEYCNNNSNRIFNFINY